MNKARRTRLASVKDKIEELQELLQDIIDEEQEAMGNLPESLQGSERYEAMEEAVSSMEEALENLGFAADNIEEVIGQ